jgi:hypothetical protein
MDANTKIGGAFVDLNADSTEEFVLILASLIYVYEHKADDWRRVSTMAANNLSPGQDLIAQLKAGEVHVQEPRWRELKIGRHTFRISADGSD